MWVGAPTVRPIALSTSDSANIAQTLHVNVGDYIFVEGERARVSVLAMSHGINSTIPGAYGVPFSFAIDQTQLPLQYERGKEEYFCAPLEARRASFLGRGSVVTDNDCIGVRRDKATRKLEWVVDNSHHNNDDGMVASR